MYLELLKVLKEDEIICGLVIMLSEFYFIDFLIIGYLNIVY